MAEKEVKLTLKQRAFADLFLKLGNATEAAIKAGYSKKTAKEIGCENLTKPNIAKYIKTRQGPREEKLIADADEVLTFYSKVMRGEIKDQFDLEASLSDRLKGADGLAKRYGLQKNENTININVPVIKDDV